MTYRAPLDEFDPAKLQDGLLMTVENVHERLREARERHPVMPGNPFTEASNQRPAVGVWGGRPRLRRVPRGAPRPGQVLVVDLRAHHGPGHGPHAARAGGSRAPGEPGPGVAVVPGEAARAVAHRARRGRGARADRPVRAARSGGPRPGVHLRVPGTGHRAADGAAARGLRALPAAVD